jgi:8-oxo-dGTP pyrophosphatase MutT (NUDIX family)
MSETTPDPKKMRDKLSHLTRDPRMEWRSRVDLSDSEFELSESAVLIPMTERDGELHIVFTERSHEMSTHSGEVSFPGGRREAEDNSLVETALREAYEEIALVPSDVEVYGALTQIPTVTGFRITAFVGEFDSPYEFIENPREIHQMFEAPLSVLIAPKTHRLEDREWNGQTFPVHFFDYDGHTIWGATGFLLFQLLQYLGLK